MDKDKDKDKEKQIISMINIHKMKITHKKFFNLLKIIQRINNNLRNFKLNNIIKKLLFLVFYLHFSINKIVKFYLGKMLKGLKRIIVI